MRESERNHQEKTIHLSSIDEERQSIMALSRSQKGAREGVAVEELSYDQKRLKMKFNRFNSALLFFQSTVGVSWFTLHQPLAEVGLYLGLIIMVVVGYVTAYGLLMLDETAVMAERDTERVDRIKNAEELCSLVPRNYMTWVKWTMMFAAMGMMMSSSISNICVVGTHLTD